MGAQKRCLSLITSVKNNLTEFIGWYIGPPAAESILA